MKYIEVVAAAMIEDDKVMITQRVDGDFDGLWEFPGGKIEEGETHTEALMREIDEELKCDIKVHDHLKTITYQYPNFHLTEHSALRWVSADELDSIEWVPADIDIIPKLKDYLLSLQ